MSVDDNDTSMHYQFGREFEFQQRVIHGPDFYADGRGPDPAAPAIAASTSTGTATATATAWPEDQRPQGETRPSGKGAGHPHRRALAYDSRQLTLYDNGGFCASWALIWLGCVQNGAQSPRDRRTILVRDKRELLYEVAGQYAQQGWLDRGPTVRAAGFAVDTPRSELRADQLWETVSSVPKIGHGGAIITMVEQLPDTASPALSMHDLGFAWGSIENTDWFRVFNPDVGEFSALPPGSLNTLVSEQDGEQHPNAPMDRNAVLLRLLEQAGGWGKGYFHHAMIEPCRRLPVRY